jgi:hypothetical protein
MTSLRHWLTELAEVYARHAARHGPNRLLPAAMLPTEVLRAHGRAPGHKGPAPQGSDPDGRRSGENAPGLMEDAYLQLLIGSRPWL